MAGMIVAPQPAAVEIGANVLAAGGNAFDAAVACAFAQFVVDPHSCGLGGYLIMACRTSEGPQPILDAPALAGSLVSSDMWEDRVIGPNPSGWGYFLKERVNEDGYLSVCTPGIVRGLQAIHARRCSRPWSELIRPAAALAEDGWTVTAHLGQRWKEKPNYYEGSSLFMKLHASPEARRIYLKPDGSAYDVGEVIRNPDYARSLRRVAEDGPDDFYTGKLAAEMTADLTAHGSWVTPEDFAGYALREEDAVVARYRDYTVVTAQAPHGGPTLAAILNILEGYDLAAMEHNSPEYLYLLAMAMKAGFADRNRYLGDPHFVDVRGEWMTSKERAAEWRTVIDAGEPIHADRAQPGSPDTTQVTTVDRWGNWVSLTHSLGSSSGAITPGLGFMYNNSMVNFHPYAGNPNSIAPRKSRTTGMAPTVVLKGDRPVLVLGAPGATRILTSVLQVILNRIDFRMSLTDAVLAPRIDCQGDMIECQARIPEGVCAEVRRRHPIRRMPRSHGGLGLVHAIAADEETGRLYGAADAGADGMALAAG